jgi:uncharacterized Zn-binding protein involved in type VI secretion
MSRAIARVGDKVSEVRNTDGDQTDYVIATGSPSVFINGKAVARLGDKDSDNDPITSASPSVFVNGIPAARIGDDVADDDDPGGDPKKIVEGSKNVGGV